MYFAFIEAIHSYPGVHLAYVFLVKNTNTTCVVNEPSTVSRIIYHHKKNKKEKICKKR
jgi:hypothetical protein